MRYFRNDDRVTSVMVEVNRRLYLDEVTGKMGARFSHVQSMLAEVLKALTDSQWDRASTLDGVREF
jgi:hypothetical protein